MEPAASRSLTLCGTGTSRSAGTTAYSEYAPCTPVHATRSPTFNEVASAPTAVTTPAPSWPGVNGRDVLYRPSRKYTSTKFTPEAANFTTASFAFGCGTG